MSRDLIRIKGGSDGFKLLVDSSANLEEVQDALDKKLQEHPEFFPEGTKFEIVAADLSKSVRKGLGDMLSSKGLNVTAAEKKLSVDKQDGSVQFKAAVDVAASQVKGSIAENSAKGIQGDSQQLMTVINRTVRNGEEINSPGSVMICGNVNPGARIVAVGSIDVRGKCRGIVHAGAAGDYQAFVVADRLMPMQICIANLIARSPDNPEASEYAEKAYIKDGQIIIEPIER